MHCSSLIAAGLLLMMCAGPSLQALPNLSEKFFHCICQIESNCNPKMGCINDPDTLSCGPYQIKEAYWTDASVYAKRKLGGSWKTCTTGSNRDTCSRETMLNFLAKYGTYCTGGRKPTMEDYARIHNGGPNGCKLQRTVQYWSKVKRCLNA